MAKIEIEVDEKVALVLAFFSREMAEEIRTSPIGSAVPVPGFEQPFAVRTEEGRDTTVANLMSVYHQVIDGAAAGMLAEGRL